jgi:hypothetical protein
MLTDTIIVLGFLLFWYEWWLNVLRAIRLDIESGTYSNDQDWVWGLVLVAPLMVFIVTLYARA